jgi:hypothetical protein
VTVQVQDFPSVPLMFFLGTFASTPYLDRFARLRLHMAARGNPF